MARPESEAPRSDIIGRTSRTIKLAMKIVVGAFLALAISMAWLANRSATTPTPTTVDSAPIPAAVAATTSTTPDRASVPTVALTTAVQPPPVIPPKLGLGVLEPQKSRVAVGERGYLSEPDRQGNVWLVFSSADLGDFADAQEKQFDPNPNRPTGSGTARYQMAKAGRILIISEGSQVEVLDVGPVYSKVRITSGKDEGKVGYVYNRTIYPVQATEAPARTARTKTQPKPPQPGPVELEQRAATLLKRGQDFERYGMLAPALENYWRILTEFPTTAAATEAAKRAESLAQ